MNVLFTLIPFSVLILTLVSFIVLLAVAIVFNFHAGMKYRTALAERLNTLRLGRMLGALGIDIDAYLARERVVDIHRQMQRCSECNNIAPCDAGLADGTLQPDNIEFCNNEQALQEMVRRKTSQEPELY
jgi:hypothetical protein